MENTLLGVCPRILNTSCTFLMSITASNIILYNRSNQRSYFVASLPCLAEKLLSQILLHWNWTTVMIHLRTDRLCAGCAWGHHSDTAGGTDKSQVSTFSQYIPATRPSVTVTGPYCIRVTTAATEAMPFRLSIVSCLIKHHGQIPQQRVSLFKL